MFGDIFEDFYFACAGFHAGGGGGAEDFAALIKAGFYHKCASSTLKGNFTFADEIRVAVKLKFYFIFGKRKPCAIFVDKSNGNACHVGSVGDELRIIGKKG